MDRTEKTTEILDADLIDDAAIRKLRQPPYGLWVFSLLLLAGLGYGGYRGVKERQRLLGELDKAGQTAQTLRATEARLEALQAERNNLVAERVALQASVQAKETALAQLKETEVKLQEKVKEEIAKGEIALSQSGGRLRVEMVDKILFDSGDARISRRGEGVLARLGGVLAKMDDKQIQVSGHTDNQPINGKLKRQFPSNWELSTSRALTVVRFLQQKAEVPAERLVASGHGEYQPIASNDTAAGRARNRRIEILLTPALVAEPVAKGKPEAAQPPARTRGRAPTARR
jgi:chemotaxis protein MotB